MSWTAKAGDEGPAVQRLRLAFGLLAGLGFDAELEAAVRSFQRAAGLKVDGAVGPKTRKALGDRLPAGTAVVDRLLWAARYNGRACYYALGAGGQSPQSVPWEVRGGHNVCECAAWVAFTLGRSKSGESDWPRWWETTNVYTDATQPNLRKVVRPCLPAAGAVLVRPDRKVNGKIKQGHMGLVVSVQTNAAGEVTACRMSDCTSARRYAGRAIGTRDGMALLKSGAIFVCLLEDPLP